VEWDWVDGEDFVEDMGVVAFSLSLRDGLMVGILARYLVPGDTVYISLGDRIPADIRLVETVDLEVDESSFTGETTPSRKHTQHQTVAAAHSNISQLKNVAFMGTFVCSGHGKVRNYLDDSFC
jgi:Ca2+-transporting ATPase